MKEREILIFAYLHDLLEMLLQLFLFGRRFQVLWRHRYQAWPRMEERAQTTFRLPPPSIEFTLTSPKIGIESLPVVDPPWMTINAEIPVNKFPKAEESHVSSKNVISANKFMSRQVKTKRQLRVF